MKRIEYCKKQIEAHLHDAKKVQQLEQEFLNMLPTFKEQNELRLFIEEKMNHAGKEQLAIVLQKKQKRKFKK